MSDHPRDGRAVEQIGVVCYCAGDAGSPIVEHNGTTPVWWLVPPQEFRDATAGGFLELVSEWEVAGGGAVEAHAHPTHEFYYILSGRGIMKIAEEERGLVLVTGTTGSGKSTTLAAMIDHINKARSAHIVTVEDPIEFTQRGFLALRNWS